MWIEKGDLVTFSKSGELITGRVIRLCPGSPKAIVRYLEPTGGYRFVSESFHYDDLRHATITEKHAFLSETKRRIGLSNA